MFVKRVAGLCVWVGCMAWCASLARAQSGDDVYWHIDPRLETCSMVVDPSLTEAQWRTFHRQVTGMISFKTLASAEPLGRWNFTVGLDYAMTPVDQRDPAWINTFAHPDANCPLGNRIEMPAIRARFGVTDRMDFGAYWTTAPNANYGMVGAEWRYVLQEESARWPATGVFGSAVTLTGVPDFDFNVFSAGVIASKRMRAVKPFLGARANLGVARETTEKVALEEVRRLLPQGFLGATCSTHKLGLALEYDVAEVNTFAFVLSFER